MSSLRIVWYQQDPVWEQPVQNLSELELAAPRCMGSSRNVRLWF
jgi:hypothetical protein